MKILELFSGTECISSQFRNAGHETFTIDFDKQFNPSWCVDITEVTAKNIIKRFGYPDVIWASPDCTTYSIAAISHHRKQGQDGLLEPKSQEAFQAEKLLAKTLELINDLKPKYWFIENPRGGMRKHKFMYYLPYRYTITYCQYGDTRMKPTDIWTNHPSPHFKPMCKKNSKCHDAAPRGSKTGTQGLKNSVERSKIPEQFCKHIANICESLRAI